MADPRRDSKRASEWNNGSCRLMPAKGNRQINASDTNWIKVEPVDLLIDEIDMNMVSPSGFDGIVGGGLSSPSMALDVKEKEMSSDSEGCTDQGLNPRFEVLMKPEIEEDVLNSCRQQTNLGSENSETYELKERNGDKMMFSADAAPELGTVKKSMTKNQKEEMVKFFEKHPCIVNSSFKGNIGRAGMNNLWDMLIPKLNEDRFGPKKSRRQWQCCWRRWKFGVKEKWDYYKKLNGKTGVGVRNRKQISELNKRIIALITKSVDHQVNHGDQLGPAVDPVCNDLPIQCNDRLRSTVGPVGNALSIEHRNPRGNQLAERSEMEINDELQLRVDEGNGNSFRFPINDQEDRNDQEPCVSSMSSGAPSRTNSKESSIIREALNPMVEAMTKMASAIEKNSAAVLQLAHTVERNSCTIVNALQTFTKVQANFVQMFCGSQDLLEAEPE